MTQENKQCENCVHKNRLSDVELFKIAKETRDFEIRMFWERTNYFLLLNSAIGAGFMYLLIRSEDKLTISDTITIQVPTVMVIFCFIGACVCLAWIMICLGSKFWQVHWEQVLVDLQPKVGLVGCKDIFSEKYTKIRVRRNIKGRCLAFLVLCKPSVSRWMLLTACFFFVVWTGAGIYSGCIIYHYAC